MTSHSSGLPFSSITYVAEAEFKKGWDLKSKWIKFVDDREEALLLRRTFSASELMMFQTHLYEEGVSATVCSWCGETFTKSRHVFWSCAHARAFWTDYLASNNWSTDFQEMMKDEVALTSALLQHKNHELCRHDENTSVQQSLHLVQVIYFYMLCNDHCPDTHPCQVLPHVL